MRGKARKYIKLLLGNNIASGKSPDKYHLELSEIISKISSETGNNGKDFLINQLNPGNFDNVIDKFLKSMGQSMAGGNKKYKQKGGSSDIKNKLKNVIIMKDNIAEGIWYIIGGAIVTLFSFSYISSMEC